MRIFHFALMLALSVGVAAGQTSEPTDRRLDDIDRRLNELESRYKAELKTRDEEIARLKQQITSAPAQSPTPPPAADDIEKTKQDILKDIETNRSSPLTLRTPANFNPDLAVIGDFHGNISTRNENPARNRFDVAAVELDLRAAVDPRADAVVVLPFV